MASNKKSTTARENRSDRMHAAQILRQRRRSYRAARHIRKTGRATLSTYGIAVGLNPTDAASMMGSVRKNAVKAGREGIAGVARTHRIPARPCVLWTVADVAAGAKIYRPRREDFKRARTALLAMAA